MVINQQNEDIPVFLLKREDGKGGKRTLHRNLLWPVNFVPITEKGTGKKIKPRRIDTTTDLVQSHSSDWDSDTQSDNSSDSEANEAGYFL